jgi:hypothetical protein
MILVELLLIEYQQNKDLIHTQNQTKKTHYNNNIIIIMLYDTNVQKQSSRSLRMLRASQYIVLCVVFALGIKTAFQTFLHRSQYTSNITNTLCSGTEQMKQIQSLMKSKNNHTNVNNVFRQPLTAAFTQQEQNELKKNVQLCDAPQNLQFKKFIWFLTDGLPVKYSMKTINHYSDHGILYTIDIPGPKYSHAIYTSYMTGQLPTNYQGKPIEGDSILKAMQRSQDIGPLTYIGPEWSFLAIQGKNNYNQLFKRILMKPEPLDQPHDRGYRFFYKDEPSKQWFKKSLDFIAHEQGSLLTHSAIFDHVNHGVYRNNPNPAALKRLDDVSGRIANDLNTVKEWIDKNPDYLLILSSDHGCDDVSNGYVMHGYSTNGNEGYVMLYNPKLQPFRQRVDVVDIAPTIAKYLSKVDIPSDNIGMVRTYFGPDAQSLNYQNNALKQNILQMVDTSIRRGVSVSKDTINNILKMKPDQAAVKGPADFNKQLIQTATTLKMNLYKLIQKPYHWVAYFGLQSFIVLLVILYRYNYNLLLMAVRTQCVKAIFESLLLTPMYFGVFINVLFVWDGWKGVIRSGSPFFVWHGYLALIVLYLLVRVMSSTSDDIKREHILDISKKLILHSLMDMTWFALFNLFKSQWKRGVDNQYFFYLPYVSLIVFILMTSNVRIADLLKPLRWIKKLITRNRHHQATEISTNDIIAELKKDYVHLVVSFILLAFMLLFEMTSVKETAPREEKAKYIVYYNVFALHRYYAIFLPLTFLYFIVTMIFSTKNLDRLIVPATLYAFAIMRDTPHARVVLIATNLQYHLLLVPAIQKISALAAENRKSNESSKLVITDKSSTSSNNLSIAHGWDTLQQAITLLLVNEPLFQFIIGKEEKLNVDAHPFAGAIGMRSHQEYPSFNAFQMGFEKWHPMLIFALFMWSIAHKLPKIDFITRRAIPVIDRRALKSHIVDLILSISALLLFNANTFLQLQLCFISMSHPFEDCVVYLFVVAANGCLFTLFHTLTEYLNIRNLLLACLGGQKRKNTMTTTTTGTISKDSSSSLLPLEQDKLTQPDTSSATSSAVYMNSQISSRTTATTTSTTASTTNTSDSRKTD